MNAHLGQPVLRGGPDLASSQAVTILLHGRNRTATQMLELAQRLDLPEMALVAVSAAAQSWYPKGFMAPVEENQPYLDDAIERLGELVRELEAAGKRRRDIALLGFSQGACLACEYVYRRGGRWGALVGLTGGLIGPPETTWALDRPLDGTPVFLGTADPDAWVPVTRVGQTAEVFTRLDAQVELSVYPGMEHLVCDDEIARARRLLVALARRDVGGSGGRR